MICTQREQSVDHVVVVVGGREPREVHPRPPDGEEHEQVAHQRAPGVGVGHRVMEVATHIERPRRRSRGRTAARAGSTPGGAPRRHVPASGAATTTAWSRGDRSNFPRTPPALHHDSLARRPGTDSPRSSKETVRAPFTVPLPGPGGGAGIMDPEPAVASSDQLSPRLVRDARLVRLAPRFEGRGRRSGVGSGPTRQRTARLRGGRPCPSIRPRPQSS